MDARSNAGWMMRSIVCASSSEERPRESFRVKWETRVSTTAEKETRVSDRPRNDSRGRLLRLRFTGVHFRGATHNTVLLARHVALQPSLDDGQRELEQRAVRVLHFERGLARP